MYLICLFYPTLVAFTNSQVTFNLLYFTLSFLLVLDVQLKNRRQSITNRTYIMVFLLFHMFIHALHAHNCTLLLTIEHEWLFVDTAFDLTIIFASSAFIIATRFVTPFSSINYFRSPPLSVKIGPTFSIRHFSQPTLANFARCICCKLLLKLLLTQLRTLHIDKE